MSSTLVGRSNPNGYGLFHFESAVRPPLLDRCAHSFAHQHHFRRRRHYHHSHQEAQLLQRGRAMLRVIEYFSKSLKITQGHWT